MHNAAFRASGLNQRYLAFDVHPDHPVAALDGMRGRTVTVSGAISSG